MLKVECYENQRLFGGHSPIIIDASARAWVRNSPMRLVAVLTVDTDDPMAAVNAAYELANAPWEPTDATGFKWPHDRIRSMSAGDTALVQTPDGVRGYICEWVGWSEVPASYINPAA